ncbi:putative membrane protein YczE [Streptacidiphilus sp. BW17]|uniref:membrane protein YczE n=1 Tax=Streptacidiphilus sp. BW17 TaxID=3156274 RepID=UPI0035113D62
MSQTALAPTPSPTSSSTPSTPGARPRLRRQIRPLVQLNIGLVLYGASTALLLRAGFGVDPWTVLHQGLHQVTGLSVGTAAVLTSLLVLALWLPLRQRPGLGTILDGLLVGPFTDATLALCPTPHALPVRVALLVGSILLNGVATACYIGAGLGAGPRDGLMTGLAARGLSLRGTRTLIELGALGGGWLLGGPVGIGTVAYAVSIGPLAQRLLPLFTLRTTTTCGSLPLAD